MEGGVEKRQAELETIVLLLPTLSRTRRDVRNIVISKFPCEPTLKYDEKKLL